MEALRNLLEAPELHAGLVAGFVMLVVGLLVAPEFRTRRTRRGPGSSARGWWWPPSPPSPAPVGSTAPVRSRPGSSWRAGCCGSPARSVRAPARPSVRCWPSPAGSLSCRRRISRRPGSWRSSCSARRLQGGPPRHSTAVRPRLVSDPGCWPSRSWVSTRVYPTPNWCWRCSGRRSRCCCSPGPRS